MSDGRRPCAVCGRRLRDEEAMTLWCGRHWWPEAALPGQAGAVDFAIFEQHVAVLCQPCAERHWPALRDALEGLASSLPPRNDQDDHHHPVGAEQGAPRRRPGEEP